MDALALESEEHRLGAEERIMAVENQFVDTLAGVETAMRQIDDLLRMGSSELNQ